MSEVRNQHGSADRQKSEVRNHQSLAELVREGITPIDLSRHVDVFCNDFERTVFPAHPELAALKQRLLDLGAYYAAMSGSGSTIFALFEDEPLKDAPVPDDQTNSLIPDDLKPLLIFNDLLP